MSTDVTTKSLYLWQVTPAVQRYGWKGEDSCHPQGDPVTRGFPERKKNLCNLKEIKLKFVLVEPVIDISDSSMSNHEASATLKYVWKDT